MHIIVNSQKKKEKQLRKWVLEDIFPRGFTAKIRELQEKHRQAVEEKETVLALISESQRKRTKLKQDTADLQAAVERLERRVVPYLEDTRKDNGMVII